MIVQRTIICLAILCYAGCGGSHLERELTRPESLAAYSPGVLAKLQHDSPYLKAHMRDGGLYILNLWEPVSPGPTIKGYAVHLGPARDTLAKGWTSLGLDSIAILETNVIGQSKEMAGITILTGITAAVTIACATNPKACFGSCPTFYVSDGDSLRLQAEGFSASIAPSLEATDVDMLYNAKPVQGEVRVEMRNEALETHVVRHVDLLAVPRHAGTRVFAGRNNQFWECARVIAPVKARAPEGDCLEAVRTADRIERFGLADENDLGAKETVGLIFNTVPGRTYGLVIGCRQTLLPTYLLYQMFGYMGNDVGHWIAEIERGKATRKEAAIEGLVGGIEASILRPSAKAQPIGVVDEHGPLAVDIHLLPIGDVSDSTVTVEMRMTKGAWRVDYVALAELTSPVEPVRLHPSAVLHHGELDNDARDILIDSTRVLVTLPGDVYTLRYELPDRDCEYELFLESRGYYLEWVRKEWIAEQNPFLLAQVIFDPEGALRRMAPQFKQVEPMMEDSFWRSRYAKP